MILDFSFSKNKAKNYSVAASIIAVPIITGPGVITTSILMVNQIGIAITSISVLLCLLIIWILLMASLKIQGKLGETNLNIISKVMGLIIASYGIKLIIAVFGF
jgi:multiple antibiotic resistance protein